MILGKATLTAGACGEGCEGGWQGRDLRLRLCLDQLKKTNHKEREKKKKRNENSFSLATSHFKEIYHLTEEVLGQGAYAVVRSCTNRLTGQVYAVKIIEKVVGYSRAKVLREIELNYKCQGHNNIIQLLEFFEEEDKFYLVFEKAHGGQLTEHLAKKGRFSEEEARNVFLDVTLALAFLHKRGVAHRDLKPENILCSSWQEMFPVKLCDFDLGSAGDNTATTFTTPDLTSMVGSAEFMAPEIVGAFASNQVVSYTKQCDVWSLGVLLYILVSGSAPFQGDCGKKCGWDQGGSCEDCLTLLFSNIYQGRYSFSCIIWDTVSEEVKDLIRRLLVKDPHKRLQAEEVMKHPWLAHGEDDKVPEKDIPIFAIKEALETVKNIPPKNEPSLSDDVQTHRRKGQKRTKMTGRHSNTRK